MQPPRTLRLVAAFVLPSVAASVALALQDDGPEPPSASETRDLVDRYLELDRFDADAATEQREIRARLDLGRPLSSSGARRWKNELLDSVVEGGRRFEDAYGAYYLYGESEGLFTVRGDTNDPEGLVLRLHGSTDLTETNFGRNDTFVAEAEARDWVVIQPRRISGGYSWTEGETERFVVEVLEAAIRTFEVDPNKVFVTGYSAGGMGTWDLGARHADRFAWLCSVAGSPSPPIRTRELADGLVPNLRNVFTLVYHSKTDARVSFAPVATALEKMDAARERWGGYAYEFVEDPRKGGHNRPREGAGVLYERVEDLERDPRPDTVVWQPTLPWKRQFAWLYWDEPVTGTLVVAELDRDANAVHVTAEGDASGLEVLLDDELLDIDDEVVVTLNGEEVYRGEPEPRLSVVVATALRGDPDLVFETSVRLP